MFILNKINILYFGAARCLPKSLTLLLFLAFGFSASAPGTASFTGE